MTRGLELVSWPMSLKKKLQFRDRAIRAITEDGNFRAVIVKATDLVETARIKHQCNPLGATILGELLTGALLSASNLKGQERLTLRLETNGSIKSAVAEANFAGEVRGYLSDHNPVPQSEHPEEMLKEALGDGLLHVTKTLYEEARPVTSTVKLEHGSVVKDLTHYFALSEQVPTAIKIDLAFHDDFSIKHAVGLMIQTMPGAEESDIIEIEKNIIDNPAPGEMLARGDYIDSILESYLKGHKAKEISRTPVDFFCRCSKERFLEKMRLLGKEDLEELAQKEQELVCHYCNEKYVISPEEIEGVMREREEG